MQINLYKITFELPIRRMCFILFELDFGKFIRKMRDVLRQCFIFKLKR